MIIEIKGFAIPTDKICSISPLIRDDKNRFSFAIQLVNGNSHNLVYSSGKEDADIARELAIKVLEGKTGKTIVEDIIKKIEAEAKNETDAGDAEDVEAEKK